MLGILDVASFVVVLGGAWWLVRRAFNGDQEPTAGGSFRDHQLLGDKNTREPRKRRRRGRRT